MLHRTSLLLVAATLVASIGCSMDRQIAPDAETSRPLSPSAAASVISMSALPHTGDQYSARIHTNMMQDVMAQRRAIRKLNSKQQCERVATIMRKHFPEIAAATGNNDMVSYEAALSAALVYVGCKSGKIAPSHSALEKYRFALQDAYLSASNPGDVVESLDAIVASDKTLSPADHKKLQSLASLGAASVLYWSKVKDDGGLKDDDGQLLMMRSTVLCGTACKIGWIDLGGGIQYVETGPWGFLLAAGVTSALAAIAM